MLKSSGSIKRTSEGKGEREIKSVEEEEELGEKRKEEGHSVPWDRVGPYSAHL
jgi:hypothetical protein